MSFGCFAVGGARRGCRGQVCSRSHAFWSFLGVPNMHTLPSRSPAENTSKTKNGHPSRWIEFCRYVLIKNGSCIRPAWLAIVHVVANMTYILHRLVAQYPEVDSNCVHVTTPTSKQIALTSNSLIIVGAKSQHVAVTSRGHNI